MCVCGAGCVSGAGKDQDSLERLILQKVDEQGHFGVMGDLVEGLGDGVGRVGATPNLHHLGVMHEFTTQLLNFARQGSGE